MNNTQQISNYENLNNSQKSKYQKRQPAIKTSVEILKKGNFIENSNWDPNYIETELGTIYRLHIIGIVVSKDIEKSLIIIDDGTGTIISRFDFFNNNEVLNFQNIKSGDCVSIIGKPRKFGDETYILTEIAKKINDLNWIKAFEIEVRLNLRNKLKTDDVINKKIEHINNKETYYQENIEKNNQNNNSKKADKEFSQEEIEEEEEKDSYEIIYNYIKNNDQGNGVSTNILKQELFNKNIENPDNLITKLLKYGELFEIEPGKIKLL